ncbi:unnamed protein product [Rotaria sp. Silwood2]|nr:unnamed protein product [Rotaria sp. Silwood2]CAF4589708.1 unnamed protein product [Rotaria sp. Silwood2]
MNPSNIVQCLAELVNIKLNLNTTQVSQKEREVAEHLSETINSFTDCKQYRCEEEMTLDLGDKSDESDDNDLDTVYCDENTSKADDEWEDKENVLEPRHLKKYSLEFMKEVVEFADTTDENGKRRRSWNTIYNRYRTLPDRTYVNRFRKYIQQHGTKRQKIENIDELVFKKFLNGREQSLPIHDLDIRRWALKAAHEHQLKDFKASDKWLYNFKCKYNIVSRKITNIITKREISNWDEIQKSEQNFLTQFNKLSSNYSVHEILNTDQVGIEREQHSTRTLSFQGEKKTYGIVSSKNATSHSYTLQPTISLAGQLVGPIYLCLQENQGKMGDIVKSRLFVPKNVVITCSSSGKLTSSLVSYWLDKCLLPSIGKKSLLLSDSWSGQNDKKIYESSKTKGKCVERIQIPQHTTADIQPLDKYYNRQMKNFIKRLYNHVSLDEIPINLYERNNIIKLVSLVHNQLSAPVFNKMIRYAWFACGYTKDDPSPFENINDVCFPHETTHVECEVHRCQDSVFLTCAHCSKKYCFEHFFVDYHYHE